MVAGGADGAWSWASPAESLRSLPTAMAMGARLPGADRHLSGTLNVGMTLGAMIPPLWDGFVARGGFQTRLASTTSWCWCLGIALYLKRIDASTVEPQPADNRQTRKPRMSPLQKQNRATDGHG
ncbi:MAG: hypothetical protein R2838_03840 [Caldilineaceae bacterium]